MAHDFKKTAIILAAGSGTRAGGEIPKQFQYLHARRIFEWSLLAFWMEDHDTELVLVIPPGYSAKLNLMMRNVYPELPCRFAVVEGGRSRTESVQKAIDYLTETHQEDYAWPYDRLIAVHDAARPLVTRHLIRRGWEAAAESTAAVPAVPMADSLRTVTYGDPAVSMSKCRTKAVDRSRYVAIQTPQVFHWSVFKDCYASRDPKALYTDDASVVEQVVKPTLYNGDRSNFKVTYPEDFAMADGILMARAVAGGERKKISRHSDGTS